MRYTKLVLMLLGLAAVLVAADSFVGTWTLNPATAKFKTGVPPKDQTVTISEEGGNLHVVIKGTSSGGQPHDPAGFRLTREWNLEARCAA